MANSTQGTRVRRTRAQIIEDKRRELEQLVRAEELAKVTESRKLSYQAVKLYVSVQDAFLVRITPNQLFALEQEFGAENVSEDILTDDNIAGHYVIGRFKLNDKDYRRVTVNLDD